MTLHPVENLVNHKVSGLVVQAQGLRKVPRIIATNYVNDRNGRRQDRIQPGASRNEPSFHPADAISVPEIGQLSKLTSCRAVIPTRNTTDLSKRCIRSAYRPTVDSRDHLDVVGRGLDS
jgi:hypothetical protein